MNQLFNRLVLAAAGFFGGAMLITVILFLAALFGAPIPDVRLVQVIAGCILAVYMGVFGDTSVVEDTLCDL